MLSVADELAIAISKRKPPFDGTCQICGKQKATDWLPTYMRYLERRVMTGDAVKVTPRGVSVGYAPANEYWRHVDIPCLFCKLCGEEFRQDWRRAKRAAIASKLLNGAFLLPLALVAIVLIALLPFVAISLAIFIVYAIYRQATRNRTDQFLAAHLRTLGGVDKLFDEDEYVIGHMGFCEIEQGLPEGAVSVSEAISANRPLENSTSHQSTVLFTKLNELDLFVDSYLEKKRPQWISAMLEFLAKQDDIPREAIAGLTGFLSEVKRENPDQNTEWNSKIICGCPALRNLYATARELTTAAILDLKPSNETNDLLWSAFRGSGNVDYIGKIIDTMHWIENATTREQLEAAVSAKWSLAAHARTFPLVHFYVIMTTQDCEKSIKKHLDDILTKDMECIVKESQRLLIEH